VIHANSLGIQTLRGFTVSLITSPQVTGYRNPSGNQQQRTNSLAALTSSTIVPNCHSCKSSSRKKVLDPTPVSIFDRAFFSEIGY